MKVRGHYNLLTLKQTVILLILFSFDNSGLSFIISNDFLPNFVSINSELVMKVEILRVILVENIFFKFLVPLYLLIQSRSKLPSLWADEDQRKLKFFMTSPSFIPRPVITKYQPSNLTEESSYKAMVHWIQLSTVKSIKETKSDINEQSIDLKWWIKWTNILEKVSDSRHKRTGWPSAAIN